LIILIMFGEEYKNIILHKSINTFLILSE
jgi:hypothetical protein